MKRKVITVFSLLVTLLTYGQSIEYNIENGYLLHKYDVVSYFNNSPKKGNAKFIYEYENIKIMFSSKKNLNLFKSNPKKYMPKYGGWCAYAIAKKGEKVSINPETYEIIDGSLYLFYNSWGTNTLELWNKENPDLLKSKANANWAQLKLDE